MNQHVTCKCNIYNKIYGKTLEFPPSFNQSMSIAATFPRICEESERETVHGHGRVLPCWQGMMMMLMVGGAMKSSFC